MWLAKTMEHWTFAFLRYIVHEIYLSNDISFARVLTKKRPAEIALRRLAELMTNVAASTPSSSGLSRGSAGLN
jgi:hypothetical protein